MGVDSAVKLEMSPTHTHQDTESPRIQESRGIYCPAICGLPESVAKFVSDEIGRICRLNKAAARRAQLRSAGIEGFRLRRDASATTAWLGHVDEASCLVACGE